MNLRNGTLPSSYYVRGSKKVQKVGRNIFHASLAKRFPTQLQDFSAQFLTLVGATPLRRRAQR
jgi:hypothetical protein